MTLLLNILLDTVVLTGIVGALAWAIHTSRPERQAPPVRQARAAPMAPTPPCAPAHGRGRGRGMRSGGLARSRAAYVRGMRSRG